MRAKIAEAFDFVINEFHMFVRNTYYDIDEDDEKYIKDLGQFGN